MTHAAARTAKLLFVACLLPMTFAAPSIARAQDVPIVVEPETPGAPIVVTPSEYVVESQREVALGQPFDVEPESSVPSRHEYLVDFSGFAEVLDLGPLSLDFSEPSVAALSGLSLGNAPFRSVSVGGISLNLAPRLWRLLRFPELRMTLAGGSFDLPYMSVAGAPRGLSVRPESLFLFRLEVAGGVQWQFGPVAPYVLARCGLAYYSVTNSVRHDDLGDLGAASAEAAAFEAALDIGVNFRIHENIEIGAAWRHQLYGPEGDGISFTLSFVGW